MMGLVIAGCGGCYAVWYLSTNSDTMIYLNISMNSGRYIVLSAAIKSF